MTTEVEALKEGLFEGQQQKDRRIKDNLVVQYFPIALQDSKLGSINGMGIN